MTDSSSPKGIALFSEDAWLAALAAAKYDLSEEERQWPRLLNALQAAYKVDHPGIDDEKPSRDDIPEYWIKEDLALLDEDGWISEIEIVAQGMRQLAENLTDTDISMIGVAGVLNHMADRLSRLSGE